MNYFELYPGDYLRDTTRLSLVDHGAYLRLLMAYYAEEQPLPSDEGELFIIVSAVSAADKTAVRKVAERFFQVGDDGLRRNGRADEEIAKARKRIDTARANGSKNKPNKHPSGNPVGMPSGNPADTQPVTQRETHSGEALHMPHAIQKQEARSNPLEQQAARKTATRFAEFWDAYPVKKGKAEAEAKWRAKGYDAIADRIIADVKRRLADDRQWLDARFIPHGSTYVNGQGWEDEIETLHGGNDGLRSVASGGNGESLNDLMARAI